MDITQEQQATIIARSIQELNRIRAEYHGTTEVPHWENETEATKNELVAYTLLILQGKSTELQHEIWFADQLSAGWVYGETYDDVAKTDPRLVHYTDYPEIRIAELKLAESLIKSLYNHLGQMF